MSRVLAEVDSRTVQQLARSKWQSSGLSDQNARRLKFRAFSGAQVKALWSKFHEAGALLIPYFDLHGRPTKFYRIRYLERLPGAAGLIEKPQRYDQMPVLQEVYYPPLLKSSWEKIANDPSVKICITEGELKAACACVVGIPTCALGGVSSFMSSKQGMTLLPSLEEFKWVERIVYVVYDNDITHKLDVMRAQIRLAETLTALGAKIMLANIPPGPDKGLDDYIVKFGAQAFREVLDVAQPYQACEALWKMNEEVVFIRKIDTVVERATGLLMDPDRFARHVYGNRHYVTQVEVGKGKNAHYVLEKAKLAPKWVEWEQRAELSELTYQPGSGRVVDGRAWNTWSGWGCAPRRGPVDQWHWLLDFLFSNDQKARKYFEQWCAYPIQHPGAKLYTAVVLWSRIKRLGKSMLAMAIGKIYGLAPLAGEAVTRESGPQNAVFVNSRQLKSSFNTWAKDRQLVIGEEITAGEARIDADYLKYIITAPTFTIDTKFKPEVEIPNHTNFLFLSNHPDAMFLEDGDKRYLIHGVAQGVPATRSKYEWCDRWLHGAGPSHLMHYLLGLSLKGFNPREHAPETISKYEMIVAGKTDTGLWVMRLQEDPVTALRALGERPSRECDIYTPDQLYRAFDPQDRARGRSSVASLGRALAAGGFRQVNGGVPVGTASGIHRLYAVRNIVRWEQSTRKEIRDHYDSYWGPKVQGGVK